MKKGRSSNDDATGKVPIIVYVIVDLSVFIPDIIIYLLSTKLIIFYSYD